MSQLNIFLNSNRKVNNFFWDISKTCFHVCSQSWHFPLPSNALLLCERCFSKSFKVGGCLDLVPPSFWPLGGLLPSIRTLPGSPISAPLPSSLPISQKPRCHRSHCTPCSIYTFSSAAEPGLKCTHHKVKNICSYIQKKLGNRERIGFKRVNPSLSLLNLNLNFFSDKEFVLGCLQN